MTTRQNARKRGQGSKWLYRPTRMALYHRDGFACVYCGARGDEGAVLTIDHVTPCELGGTNETSNLVTACLSDNSAKRDLSLRDWLATLRDRGVDTNGIASRIRKLTRTPLNRAEGRRLANV